MSKTVQFKRGNANVSATYVGAQGELTVNTDNYTLNVHDGITPGGYSILNSNVSNIGNLVVNNQTITGTVANTNITLSPTNANVVLTSNLITPNIAINRYTISSVQSGSSLTLPATSDATDVALTNNFSNIKLSVFDGTTNAPYTLVLDTNSYLTLPGYIKSNLGGAEIQFAGTQGMLFYANFATGRTGITLDDVGLTEIFANTSVAITTDYAGAGRRWTFNSNGTLSSPGNLAAANLLISHTVANNTVQARTLANSDLQLSATNGTQISSIYLWANNQRMSFNTVSNAFDFNFNGQLSATDFTASKNSAYGYSFYSEGSGYSGMRHTSGPPDVITIEHEGNVFAGFYGNYTTEIFGNLVVSSDGQSFGSFPNAYTQIYSNVNSYAQLVLQNINDGELSSADLVVTSDNGNDASYYVDLGITSSDHTDPDFFGDTTSVNDAYLYVTGYDQVGPSLGNVGNLIIGSTNGIVKTFIGNTAEANVITTVNSDGLTVSGNVTANYFIGDGSQLTGISTSFDLEMHVSKDGNDSTGTGTILRPYLSITHALTQVAGGRNTIVIHPGGYTENPTITNLDTQLITYDATGASTLVYGTVTIANTTGRIAGLKMTNLAITGNAQAYINSSTVDEQFTKSSSGYVEVDDCELQVTGNVLISGSGTTTIIGNKIANLVVNNAGASVLVKGANDCLMPRVTAGSLNIVDSIIRASSNTANAVTTSAGTVVTLMNNQVVTPAADSVARVSITGFHSIISVVYDKANSTLSNSLNSVAYFQTANVDSLVSSGNVTGGNILTAGLISVTGNVSGNFFIGNGSQLTGITASANTGNVTFNDQAVVGTGNPEGGGGLYLAPGTESVGNLQYIRVRGGDVATHIHLDTGNNAYFDQYFGDDSKYVKLEAGATGNIMIGTNAINWNFDASGDLTVPGAILTASASKLDLVGFGSNTAYLTTTADDSTALFMGAVVVDLRASDSISITTNTDSTSYQWTFDETGNLALPSGGLLLVSGGIVAGPVVASPAPYLSGFGSISSQTMTASGNITAGNINSNVNGFAIGYRDIPQVVFTSNSTLALTDAGKHYYSANSANVITVPNNATVSFNIGTAISIVQQGTANLTVTPGSGVTMYLAGNSTSASRTLGNFGMATLMKVGTDTWFINGTGVN